MDGRPPPFNHRGPPWKNRGTRDTGNDFGNNPSGTGVFRNSKVIGKKMDFKGGLACLLQ